MKKIRRTTWGVRVGVYLVVADVERVLDDAADQLRREEVGELRGEGRGEGVEVGALGSARLSSWLGIAGRRGPSSHN